jgi:hypothetical protein
MTCWYSCKRRFLKLQTPFDVHHVALDIHESRLGGKKIVLLFFSAMKSINKTSIRKPFAARECSTCKIRHPAREGDIWAETSCFGFRWKYLALMEGNVYDITQWALCQRGALSHLQANSCVVQYKIVLGGNQQQNQSHDKEKFKKDAPVG